jgi:hypothetical protein
VDGWWDPDPMATPPPGGPGGPVSFQIACSSLSNLVEKSSFLDTFYTLITVGKVLRPFLRPPFYTLITVGEGLLSE